MGCIVSALKCCFCCDETDNSRIKHRYGYTTINDSATLRKRNLRFVGFDSTTERNYDGSLCV